MSSVADPRDQAFLHAVDLVTRKMGRQCLTDDDLLLLACEEISRTVTHEEKHYQAGSRTSS